MTRHLFIFFGTFVLGAILALGARTATHAPHAAPETPSSPGPSVATAHAAHAATAKSDPSTPPANLPVNTICAICGMPVDPKLPTATYQGKTIGFGCKMCPAKFHADPDKYGPIYLRNEVAKN